MLIDTRDFGQVEIAAEDVVEFVQPVYGFEELKKYAFLYEEGFDHVVWMQSTEDAATCFTLINPAIVDPHYNPGIPKGITAQLGKGAHACWLITVLTEPFADSTVNLKSPVVLNADTKRGAQVILDEDYPIRAPLYTAEKEGATC